MSELWHSCRSEGYAACDDDVGDGVLDVPLESRADMESAPTVLFVMFIVFALGFAIRCALLPDDS